MNLTDTTVYPPWFIWMDSLDMKSCRGYTSLMLAVSLDHHDVAKLFVEEGASVEFQATDGSEFYPLLHAAKQNNAELVELLVQKGKLLIALFCIILGLPGSKFKISA